MESSDQSNPRKNRSNRVAPPESLGRLLQQLKEEKEKLKESESESSEATSERVNSLREEIRTLRLELFGGQGGARGMPEQPMIRPSPRDQSTSMEGKSTRQSQPVSCRPHENEIGQSRRGSKKGKHGGSAGAAAPTARPNHDSAMDQQQVQDQGYHEKVDVSGGDGDDDMKKDMDRGKSAQQIAKEEEEMAFEAKTFASYRTSWESNWGASGRAFFEDTTTVSPMHFTHCTPGCDPGDAAIAGATLQIFTIKLLEIKGGSFLRLIGPSRAIVFTDDVYFEIKLKVKGKTLSQDKALISGRRHYSGGRTICFSNCFCTIELCMERIHETVQATILGVRVKNGPWPFDYGGQALVENRALVPVLACQSPSRTYKVTGGKVTYTTHAPSMEVVMLPSCGRTMPKGSHGYLRLSRHVVSVELEGSLNVVIQAYSESGDITAQGEVYFMPKACNISQETCFLGDRDTKVEVDITVAWSLLVLNRRHLMMNGMDFDELKEAVSGLGV
ncbi:hypothetical protein VPH35_035144 [Triticum aestivum]